MTDPFKRLQANYQSVLDDVAEAERHAGVEPGSTRIVGVTKYVGVELSQMLATCGCHHLGESRPQSLWQKAESEHMPDSVHWHLIGHLQRNKVRRLLRHRVEIHSVDSLRLLKEIAAESVRAGITTPVFLEVNISGEDAKTGLPPDKLRSALNALPPEGIAVQGLMAMAGWGTTSEEARRQFARTRELRDQLQQETGVDLPQLSMGMSGDFAEAIAEGATVVRIGSRLFEGLREEIG